MSHEYTPESYSYDNRGPAEALTTAEIADRMHYDRFVKESPRLFRQLEDDDRINQLVYISDSELALFKRTSDDEYAQSRETISEIDALRELDVFLAVVEQELPGKRAAEARLMREKLTYIGDKEYKEAAAGIAAYWKQELDRNPQLQLLAVVGEIAKRVGLEKGPLPIKSDEYLLENVLGSFSDEELERYAGRLLVNPGDARVRPDDVRVILLDDWTISGSQIDDAHLSLMKRYPALESSIEVHLVVADKNRITEGIGVYTGASEDRYLPVRAYYEAHDTGNDKDDDWPLVVTGSHSSVDLGFEEKIADMVADLKRKGIPARMPAPTNIVRPYRYEGVTRASLVQRARLEHSLQASSVSNV